MLTVTGLGSAVVGELAATYHVVLHELSPVHASLEDAYLSLTRDDVQYSSSTVAAATRRAAA